MAVHNPNWPLVYDQLAVNIGGNDTSADPVWLDITDRVVTRSLRPAGRSSEMEHIEAGEATYRIRDRDETFNPANTASPYYGLLLPNRRIRTLAMWPLTGNIFNNTQPSADFFTLFDQTSSFEGSGNGGWTAKGTTPPTLNGPSTAWAQHGTKSMLVTLPTGAGGRTVTAVQSPQTGPTPWGLCIGQTYAYSVYVNRPAGGTPNIGLALASGTPITAAAGFSLTTTATGVTRLAGTFVCQDASNDVPVLFPVAATTAGQTFAFDAVQLEWGASVSAYTSTGPLVYQPFIGFVERWPKSWTSQGLYGWVELTCTDELGTYGSTTFVNPLYHRALDDGPAALYPLTEPDGATAAGNVAGVAQPSMVSAQIGGGGGVFTWSGEAGPAGVSGQVLQITQTSASVNGLYLSTGPLTTELGGGAGLSLYAWVKMPTALGWPQPTTLVSAWNNVNDYISLAVGTDGGLRVYAKLPGVAAETAFPGGVVPVCDGQWHFAGVVVSCAGTTYTITIVVDDVSWGTTTVTVPGAVANQVGPYRTLTAAGIPKGRLMPSGSALCYVGALSYAIAWGDLIIGVRQAGLDGFAGDSTLTRFARIHNWFGRGGLISGSTSVLMQGAQVHNGKTAPEIYADIVDTEGGALYVRDGRVTLQTRSSRALSLTPLVTFGEDTTAGEVPYEQDVEFTADDDFIFNDVTVNQANGVSVRVVDPDSERDHFQRDTSVTIYSQDPADAADHANYLLWAHSQPRTRVGTLSVEAGSRGTGAWRAVLASQVPTLILVKRRLSNGVTVSGLHSVDRVTHDTTQTGWKTSIQASPVDPVAFWVLGDATRGVLGSTTIAGW